jgi:hypothetical protein
VRRHPGLRDLALGGGPWSGWYKLFERLDASQIEWKAPRELHRTPQERIYSASVPRCDPRATRRNRFADLDAGPTRGNLKPLPLCA